MASDDDGPEARDEDVVERRELARPRTPASPARADQSWRQSVEGVGGVGLWWTGGRGCG